MPAQKQISTGYQPRPLQDYLHPQLLRFNVIVCHRRFGKTVFVINELIDQAMRCRRENPQYAYIAPTYGQAERIAWDMLKKYTRVIPGVTYNESKLTCTIPHATGRIKIMLLGAENPDSIRGIYLDGAIFDEFAEMDPRVWSQVVRPAVADRLGWAIFIGTPKGENHFYDVLQVARKNKTKNWFWCMYKASQTNIIPKEELDSLRAEMSDEEYAQEMECSFTAALIGSYWGKQISAAEEQKRICRVPHDPALQVDTFWDLGVNDTTSVWFIQQFRNEVRCIDYLEQGGEGLPYYVKTLKEGHRRDYCYRDHNWPHDGGSRDLSTGRERSAVMRDLGVRVYVHKKYDLADGINAGRLIIPRAWFDIDKCERGIAALKNYQKRWDPKNKIFLDQPLHNWASNGADAWRLVGMTLKPGEDRLADKRNLPRKAETDYNVFEY
jgi:phage terminase large subunit